MAQRDPRDLDWAAGVISCFGIFLISKHAKPVMMLVVKSKRHPDMVDRLAKIARKKVNKKPGGHEFIISHYDLDIFWALIFKQVTPARVAEYESVRGEVERRRKEYEEKLAYRAERAAAQPSPREVIRHRDEALYHNQDPAVIVVDGFVEAEMATAYDLEQAQLARQREQREKAS